MARTEESSEFSSLADFQSDEKHKRANRRENRKVTNRERNRKPEEGQGEEEALDDLAKQLGIADNALEIRNNDEAALADITAEAEGIENDSLHKGDANALTQELQGAVADEQETAKKLLEQIKEIAHDLQIFDFANRFVDLSKEDSQAQEQLTKKLEELLAKLEQIDPEKFQEITSASMPEPGMAASESSLGNTPLRDFTEADKKDVSQLTPEETKAKLEQDIAWIKIDIETSRNASERAKTELEKATKNFERYKGSIGWVRGVLGSSKAQEAEKAFDEANAEYNKKIAEEEELKNKLERAKAELQELSSTTEAVKEQQQQDAEKQAEIEKFKIERLGKARKAFSEAEKRDKKYKESDDYKAIAKEYREARAEVVAGKAERTIEERMALVNAQIEEKQKSWHEKSIFTRCWKQLGEYNLYNVFGEKVKFDIKEDQSKITRGILRTANFGTHAILRFASARTALSFSMLGAGIGAVSVGGAGIAAGGVILGVRRGLAGMGTSIGTYDSLQSLTDAWGRNFGKRKELTADVVDKMKPDEIVERMAHFETMAKMGRIKIEENPTYDLLVKSLQKQLESSSEIAAETSNTAKEKRVNDTLDLQLQQVDARVGELAKRAKLKNYSLGTVSMAAGAAVGGWGYLRDHFWDSTPLPKSALPVVRGGGAGGNIPPGAESVNGTTQEAIAESKRGGSWQDAGTGRVRPQFPKEALKAEQNITPAQIKYQGGHSIWEEAQKQYEARFGEKFTKLGEAEKTWDIDLIKDKIAANPQEYGLSEGVDIDTLTKEQLQHVAWDKLLGTVKPDLLDPHLTPAQIRSIIENNKEISDWVKAHPGEHLTSERVETILHPRQDVVGQTTIQPQNGAASATQVNPGEPITEIPHEKQGPPLTAQPLETIRQEKFSSQQYSLDEEHLQNFLKQLDNPKLHDNAERRILDYIETHPGSENTINELRDFVRARNGQNIFRSELVPHPEEQGDPIGNPFYEQDHGFDQKTSLGSTPAEISEPAKVELTATATVNSSSAPDQSGSEYSHETKPVAHGGEGQDIQSAIDHHKTPPVAHRIAHETVAAPAEILPYAKLGITDAQAVEMSKVMNITAGPWAKDDELRAAYQNMFKERDNGKALLDLLVARDTNVSALATLTPEELVSYEKVRMAIEQKLEWQAEHHEGMSEEQLIMIKKLGEYTHDLMKDKGVTAPVLPIETIVPIKPEPAPAPALQEISSIADSDSTAAQEKVILQQTNPSQDTTLAVANKVELQTPATEEFTQEVIKMAATKTLDKGQEKLFMHWLAGKDSNLQPNDLEGILKPDGTLSARAFSAKVAEFKTLAYVLDAPEGQRWEPRILHRPDGIPETANVRFIKGQYEVDTNGDGKPEATYTKTELESKITPELSAARTRGEKGNENDWHKTTNDETISHVELDNKHNTFNERYDQLRKLIKDNESAGKSKNLILGHYEFTASQAPVFKAAGDVGEVAVSLVQNGQNAELSLDKYDSMINDAELAKYIKTLETISDKTISQADKLKAVKEVVGRGETVKLGSYTISRDTGDNITGLPPEEGFLSRLYAQSWFGKK